MRCAELEEKKQPQICYFLKNTYRFGLLRTVDVNHGTGGRVPQNLEWGTLVQIVPPDFHKMPLRNHQNTPFQSKNSILYGEAL